MLTELLLQRAGLAPRDVNGYDDTEITHSAVAAFIASGMADAGIGVQTAAHRFGLPFIPLLRERYYLAVPASSLSEEPVPAQYVRWRIRAGAAFADRRAGRLRGRRDRPGAEPGERRSAEAAHCAQPMAGATGRNRTCA